MTPNAPRKGSRRLRRGLATVGIALALPAAFATSQAAAKTAPIGASCSYAGQSYSSGAYANQNGHNVRCNDGGWIDVS